MKRTVLLVGLGGVSCTPPVRDGARPSLFNAVDTGESADCDAPFVAYFDGDGKE